MYSNDGLSRNYGTGANPQYPEAAYGFQRFQAQVGKTDLVGFDRLNPQLQEQVIMTSIKRAKPRYGQRRLNSLGRIAPAGARNVSARPWSK